ncbi:MAG TPA: LysE family transporter [Rhodocyclaceae bacterium]|nr:LysE family transporter [Rhodocyclaceae bacterium]
MAWQAWLAFLLTSITISVSPGPGAFASMASGLRSGFPGGYGVAVGLQLGLLAQLAVVAVGIGALIMSSLWAFEVVRWAGVAYLAFLGAALLFSRVRGLDPAALGRDADREPWSTQIVRGFLVNSTNPKALLFSFAVLPQFIDGATALAPQYVLMGLTMVAVDGAVMAGYTGLAAKALDLLKNPRHLLWLNRVLGILFLAVATGLAVFRQPAVGG